MVRQSKTVNLDEIDRVIQRLKGLEGPLLPILHALQEHFGYIPAESYEPICDALAISRAELHGVVTFYHDFREKPAGRHVLKICRAEACQSVGVSKLAETLLEKLGLEWYGTTKNGALTVEPVYCLGLCACGPAVMLDETPVGRVDAARLEDILAKVGA